MYQFGGLMRSRCVSEAFYANDTNVQTFIAVNNLTQGDFVCGSGFLEYHEAYEGYPYYQEFLDAPGVDTLALVRTQSCSVAAT